MLILLNMRSNDETYVKLKTPIFGVVDRVGQIESLTNWLEAPIIDKIAKCAYICKGGKDLENHRIDSEIVGLHVSPAYGNHTSDILDRLDKYSFTGLKVNPIDHVSNCALIQDISIPHSDNE